MQTRICRIFRINRIRNFPDEMTALVGWFGFAHHDNQKLTANSSSRLVFFMLKSLERCSLVRLPL